MTGPTQKKLTQQQAIAAERDLAKFANTMDSLVRIPFTKQGLGADAALSTIPFAGDVAGFVLTLYAFKKAREVGVPQYKLKGVVRLAIMDMLEFLCISRCRWVYLRPYLSAQICVITVKSSSLTNI